VSIHRATRRHWLGIGGAVVALACAPAAAQPLGLARESAVKAAFLYKFGSFVEWPPGAFATPDAPFLIGVYGDEAVAAELEQITQDRNVEGHPVRVVRVRGPETVPRLHILYAGGPRQNRIREVIAAVRGPVLTVADGAVGGQPGPVLHFSQEEGRVRFTASLAAAAAQNLKLSAKLLAVAQQVEGR